MQGIRISIHFIGARSDIALLTILGYVDTTTCTEMTRILKELIQKKVFFIIADMGNVSYVSSAGWGVFVGEIKNIRDHGGDLKIVQMNPEVFEVFEMLEFNRILNYYDSIEEAIDEFDILRGIDITKVVQKAPQPELQASLQQSYGKPTVAAGSVVNKTKTRSGKQQIATKDLPLVEKLKLIVIENPTQNARSICQQLRKDEYGCVRLNWWKARSILKKLNLETKEKRYRYYRSR